MGSTLRPRLVDIAVNLTDPCFRGVYRGKTKHVDDFQEVMRRARCAGVDKIVITGTSLSESHNALELAHREDPHGGFLYTTVGCHPTECQAFERHAEGPDDYYERLRALVLEGASKRTVVAIGECGLDYDRLEFCPADVQKLYFKRQLGLARETRLPLFLHSRNTGGDMGRVLAAHAADLVGGGVVHSFTGDGAELKQMLDLGLYIGVNGCSLKTAANVETVRKIPLDRLLLETDAPWCEIRNTHESSKYLAADFATQSVAEPEKQDTSSSDKQSYEHPSYFFNPESSVKRPEAHVLGKMVKGRNEPAMLLKILAAVANIRGEPTATVADAVYENARRLFSF